MPLALSRDPGPTPSVGHVTGDMKRHESNETQKNYACAVMRLREVVICGCSLRFVSRFVSFLDLLAPLLKWKYS